MQDRRVAIVSSLHFLLGPVVALSAMGVIAGICRWVFSTEDRDGRRLEKVLSTRGDLGLLVPVATVRNRDDAEMLRDVLREAGVRASVSEDELELQVLVFAKDLERARQLVAAP
ncbi:MAG: hypothetical protein JWO27_1164 [Frankiales bacterium]|jgi:hypothetical protein|nr:hypothetical protein [Frankiales bacterium]MCW2707628.1 hypothetical protein [Frankiales bacterium]